MGSREIWDRSSRMRGVWGQLGLCAEPENLCGARDTVEVYGQVGLGVGVGIFTLRAWATLSS